jgi:hypothetical protein
LAFAGFTFGVIGQSASDAGRGVFGLATDLSGIGVMGKALPGSKGYAVWGEAYAPSAIDGVHGLAHTQYSGVAGENDGTGYGVWGEAFGRALDGVHGVSNNAAGSGVAGVNFAGGHFFLCAEEVQKFLRRRRRIDPTQARSVPAKAHVGKCRLGIV